MPSASARKAPRGAPLALLIGFAATLPGIALAARVNYEVGASFLRSDNINLAETAPIDENVLMPFLRFDAEQTGSVLELKLRGDLQYLDYLDDVFDDGFRGDLAGEATWTMVPERVDFVFEDVLSRQPVNVLSAFTPGNEQQVNVFTLGPTFRARFGDAMRGQLDLRYSDTYAEDDETFNGGRYALAGRLLRELADGRRLSGNLEAARVDFSLGDASDYTRYDGYLGYVGRSKRFDFSLDAGYTQIRPRVGGDRSSSPLLRGTLDWRISPWSTLTSGVSYEFADAARNLAARVDRAGAPVVGVDGTDVQTGPDLFRQRRLELGYRFTGERFTAEVQPYYRRARYVDVVGLDQTVRGAYAVASYKVQPRWTLSFTAAAENRRFDDQSRRDDDRYFGIGVLEQFTRHWSGRIDLQRRTRDSSVAGQDYDENAAIVSIAYRR